MVFYIDSSIKDQIAANHLDESLQIFFSELANAHRQGLCMLCGNLESIDSLYRELGCPASDIFRLIASSYVEHRAIMEAVASVFVLTFRTGEIGRHLPDFLQDKYLAVPINEAIKWRLNEGCSLLAENLEDCKFYQLVGDNYRMVHRIKSLRINFHYENGGGNTICDVLKKCVYREKKPTLCIVDSDQKYGEITPSTHTPKRGETLLRVLHAKQDLDQKMSLTCLYQICPLWVHEVENLIPLPILHMLTETLPDMALGLEVLERLKSIQDGKPILYYDFKNGISNDSTLPKRVYWESIVDLLRAQTDLYLKYPDMGEAQILPRLSKTHLLERANQKIALPIEILDEYLKKPWEELGIKILTWGCVNQPCYA